MLPQNHQREHGGTQGGGLNPSKHSFQPAADSGGPGRIEHRVVVGLSAPVSQFWFHGDAVVAADGRTEGGDLSQSFGSPRPRGSDFKSRGGVGGDDTHVPAGPDAAGREREARGVEQR